MSLTDIKALPVANFANPDCVLLLWTTDPFLRHAFDVIDAWGFTYKTVGFVWAKTRRESVPPWTPEDFPMGTGYWSRANPEYCLLATKGHPSRINNSVRELVISPRREHSQKPDEMYGFIEQLCSGPYLELFARQQQPGWDTAFSNQVESGITPRRWASNAGPQAPTQSHPHPTSTSTTLPKKPVFDFDAES